MARTKLTLSVDAALIRRAKRFSARHDTTVSQLVSDFLASLDDEATEVGAVVASLRGVLPPGTSRDDYREHLSRKHGA